MLCFPLRALAGICTHSFHLYVTGEHLLLQPKCHAKESRECGICFVWSFTQVKLKVLSHIKGNGRNILRQLAISAH